MGLWNWTRTEPLWSFVVDTDSYSGNFERELSSYVVGCSDDSGSDLDDDDLESSRNGPYIRMYRKDFKGKDPFEDLVDMRVCDPGDDGIHRAPMDLAPTPGWCNDGHGKHTKLKPGKKAKWPAYQSVAIFLTRKPTAKELAMLSKRARAFSDLPPRNEWDVRPKVLGCRLVEETISIVSTDVP